MKMKSFISTLMIFLLCTSNFACVSMAAHTEHLQIAPTVSVDDLLSRPSHFNGMNVRLAGWITFENENYNIWQSKKYLEEFDIGHCISLYDYVKLDDRSFQFNRKKVYVSGVFYADITNGKPMIRLNACSKSAISIEEVALTN